MAKFLISGGNKLEGTIQIGGNKNTILPCLAATLLTQDEVVLHNVPEISDVEVSLEILRSLGAQVSREGESVRVKAGNITNTELNPELVKKLRASILFAGPLLAREKKAAFSHPGGDVIGKRSITTHILGFEQLGFKFEINDQNYSGTFDPDALRLSTIFLEEASCTGCENIILACCLSPETITLKNCPEEPQIVDLCNMLSQMGVKIDGIGTSKLIITGTQSLHGTEFRVGADYTELGTYAIAAALTGGKIRLENCNITNLEPVILPLQKMGLVFEAEENAVTITTHGILPIPKLHTNIWPGFPTDLMSVMIVLATQASGVSLLHDWMYESRMFFADKLISMGAEIFIADPHRVIVSGPTQLHARNLESPDIRAGMALVLAALIAQGESTINKAELIERGYEKVVEKLQSLGAQIQLIS